MKRAIVWDGAGDTITDVRKAVGPVWAVSVLEGVLVIRSEELARAWMLDVGDVLLVGANSSVRGTSMAQYMAEELGVQADAE